MAALQVSAVMGPSGSGKSTLLAVLMGTATYANSSGQIWINGRLMKVSRLRRIVGYVPQVSSPPFTPFYYAALPAKVNPAGPYVDTS
jgi:ABC-type multidrug transport system ATPase subunit